MRAMCARVCFEEEAYSRAALSSLEREWRRLWASLSRCSSWLFSSVRSLASGALAGVSWLGGEDDGTGATAASALRRPSCSWFVSRGNAPVVSGSQQHNGTTAQRHNGTTAQR